MAAVSEEALDASYPSDGEIDFEELHPPDVDYDFLEQQQADGPQQTCIPFLRIYETPLAFRDIKQRMLIPDTPIEVQISDQERSPVSNILNPILYVIDIKHGDHQWTIKRRYKHFQHLHQQLLLFKASLALPFPTKRHKEMRRSFKVKERQSLPRFPNMPEALISHDKLQRRADHLEAYLRNVLEIPMYRNYHELMRFLEISPLSFVDGLGKKGKEGMVLKRSGGHHVVSVCTWMRRVLFDICGRWKERWMIIKDTYVMYMRPRDGRIRCVILMDRDYLVQHGLVDTGIHHGVVISNLQRNLVVKCWTKRKTREWVEKLVEAGKTSGLDFTTPNRYDSFAPERHNTDCNWYIDGASYFDAVADALEAAKEEIYIADWWLSPEIYMKRPVIHGEMWRLDRILQRKASHGVRVYVLLYKEVEMALGIKSMYSKQKLVGMHPNIKVLRHPDHAIPRVLLWAHHEKIVVIDQTYAFLGGIDLCYGRWDNYMHKLTDVGGVALGKEYEPILKTRDSSRPLGKTHKRSQSATRLSDVVCEAQVHSVQVNEVSQKPMPLSTSLENVSGTEAITINVQMATPTGSLSELSPASEADTLPIDSLSPESADIDKHEDLIEENLEVKKVQESTRAQLARRLRTGKVVQAVARFNALRRLARRRSLESLDSLNMDYQQQNSLDVRFFDMKKTSSEMALDELGLQGTAKLWIGKDYTNFIVKDFVNLDQPYQDLVDRQTTPRMPWHDIGAFVQGEAARDVARHFIQRWNMTKFEKAKFLDRYPWLLPKSYEGAKDVPSLKTLPKKNLICANCQILRSASSWSLGLKDVESSIQNAYIDAIDNAKHYIYIENQFFITQAAGHKDVTNQIAEALYRRIVRAHRNGEVFRVYVVMPLLPAFEGEIGTARGTSIQAITHWNYASIGRGPDSLLQRLARAVGDPMEYIAFFGLRNHGELNNQLVTELVYVHSKLMIVDDRVVIIGSANINDRSLTGKRDSEVAVIVHDVEYEKSIMNGQPYESGNFAGSLRRMLFREHLGILENNPDEIDVRDPVVSHFFKDVWIRRAAFNSSVFERVFHCLPSDQVRNFSQLKEYLSDEGLCKTDPDEARDLVQKIQGHLVLMPLFFLEDEVLTPASGTKEALMPVSLWT